MVGPTALCDVLPPRPQIKKRRLQKATLVVHAARGM